MTPQATAVVTKECTAPAAAAPAAVFVKGVSEMPCKDRDPESRVDRYRADDASQHSAQT
jgi:hypothetical protein